MQMLHHFTARSSSMYKNLSDPDRYRPDHGPLCHAQILFERMV
jgi:hypothetical protein